METDAITWVICPVTVFKFGRVAQLVEQVTFNHWVTGFPTESTAYVTGQVTRSNSLYLNDGDLHAFRSAN